MTEKSWLWTTGGAGDGASTYTRSDWGKAFKIVASCRASEGVVPNFLNELVGSVPSANTARIGTGAALVDGKPYENSAPVDVTIPSAVGAGNTRIDRIVLRANWTAQTVRITRIAGTDAVSPTAPAITQTSETTYDIMLYRALVTTAGVVTLTDERVMADLATGEISSTMIADNAIIAAKIPAGSIPQSKMVNSKPYGVEVGLINNNTFGPSSFLTVPWTSENFDDDSMHDNSTNPTRLTCKRAGRYLVYCSDELISGIASNPVSAYLTINGVTDILMDKDTQGSYGVMLRGLKYLNLAVNDYIEIKVGGNSGAVIAITNNSYFGMVWDG